MSSESVVPFGLTRPRRHYATGNQARFNASRSSIELLAGLGVESCILVLKVRDAHHQLSVALAC